MPDESPEHVENEPTIIYKPAGRSASGASGSSVAGKFGWALTVETGPQAGLTYVLGSGATLIGRGAECDIFLGDVTVSRHHATVTASKEALTVEDLGSTNGTYVNGSRAEEASLTAGDELIIGKFHLIVSQGDT
jgi:pSer/pThr/pTyr-binding forkhead associated (FHA) protein